MSSESLVVPREEAASSGLRPPLAPALLDVVLIGAFLALTFLLGAFPLKDTDFWWHLRTGDLIRQTGQVPRTDLYTFTAADHRWIDLHWGFQVALSWGYRSGRGRGLEPGQVRDHLRGGSPARHRATARLADLGVAAGVAARPARAGRADVHPARDVDAALPGDRPGDPLPLGALSRPGLALTRGPGGLGQLARPVRPRPDSDRVRAVRRAPPARRVRPGPETLVADRRPGDVLDRPGVPGQPLRRDRRALPAPARADDGQPDLRAVDCRADADSPVHPAFRRLAQPAAPVAPGDDGPGCAQLPGPARLDIWRPGSGARPADPARETRAEVAQGRRRGLPRGPGG